jgi:uncharacterized membrane protein YgcG
VSVSIDDKNAENVDQAGSALIAAKLLFTIERTGFSSLLVIVYRQRTCSFFFYLYRHGHKHGHQHGHKHGHKHDHKHKHGQDPSSSGGGGGGGKGKKGGNGGGGSSSSG